MTSEELSSSRKARADIADAVNKLAILMLAKGFHHADICYGVLYAVSTLATAVVEERRVDLTHKQLAEMSVELYSKLSDTVSQFVNRNAVTNKGN